MYLKLTIATHIAIARAKSVVEPQSNFKMARRALVILVGAWAAGVVAGTSLVSCARKSAAIPNWDLQSSSLVKQEAASLSLPGVDTSSWHHADTPRCTLMGCLINAGVYDDTDLWFSDNLKGFNWGQFSVPWIYRNEFTLKPQAGQHFILQTNGISSKADLFFNGEQIADSEAQAGAYAGHVYDVTSLAAETNALVVQTYPTDYNYDFALGWVDWNPYPPDNGTGVWREITLKQTGAVSLDALSVSVEVEPSKAGPAQITLRTWAKNLEDRDVDFVFESTITEASASKGQTSKHSVTLGPKESRLLEVTETLENPKIWWPKQWGDQPLYTASLSGSVASAISDTVEASFGVRTASYKINEDDDGIFSVNGEPFQVIGGGYGADMFLRWDSQRFTTIIQYMLDMGLNTIRLEGKMEHPELYEITDRLGMMVLAGWECCDKWEAWSYNEDLGLDPVPVWDEHDYQIANASMEHEAMVLQPHPSVLGFLVGSDYWPNDQATEIYVDAFERAFWQAPIVASASKRGFPDLIGPSGMKMDGPYDWVPPNYWYDREPYADRLGSAFGFGSELGAGVGTPEIGSLKKFLTQEDMDDLWKKPEKGLYHMSTNVSSFYDRVIYNDGLFGRYGTPKSLDGYLLKAQMMDYEATRAQHEGFSSKWTTGRVATGTIYWMLNNAWPSLHWNQFDQYLHPAGSYYGSKVGSRIEHVSYDYMDSSVWLINHSLDQEGSRSVDIEVIDLAGRVLSTDKVTLDTTTNSASSIASVSGLDKAEGAVFLRLLLSDHEGKTLSRNVYWIAETIDTLDWDNSTWYHTPVTKYADFTALSTMDTANVSVDVKALGKGTIDDTQVSQVVLENTSSLPAFFVRLNLVDADGNDALPVLWSDNYVTLWPNEKLELEVTGWGNTGAAVEISGANIDSAHIDL